MSLKGLPGAARSQPPVPPSGPLSSAIPFVENCPGNGAPGVEVDPPPAEAEHTSLEHPAGHLWDKIADTTAGDENGRDGAPSYGEPLGHNGNIYEEDPQYGTAEPAIAAQQLLPASP